MSSSERGRRSLRGLFLALLIGGMFPVVGAAPQACAGAATGQGGSAALVVDTGSSEHTFCVALPDDEVSGLDLIVLAHEQHGLDYRFGFGGEAVCMLAGVGADGDDCFERYPDFWGYWRGDGSGGWQWSGSGAGSSRVGNGDVEGWAWGSGSDGSTHPAPPTTPFDSVCGAAAPGPADPPEQEPGNREDGGGRDDEPRRTTVRAQSPAAGPHAAATGDARLGGKRGARGDRPEARKGPRPKPVGARWRRVAELEPTPGSEATPEALPAVARGEPVEEPAGPPAAGLAAIAGAGLVAAAGFVFARRRRSAP